MLEVISGIVGIVIGLGYFAIALWPRRLFGQVARAVTIRRTGFGLFFTTVGIIVILSEIRPTMPRGWLAVPAVVGWIIVAAGFAMGQQNKSRGERRGRWVHVIVGIVFLVAIVTLLLRHG